MIEEKSPYEQFALQAASVQAGAAQTTATNNPVSEPVPQTPQPRALPAPQAPAPVVPQMQVDTTNLQGQPKSDSFKDKALTAAKEYSGVIALVSLPVMGFVAYKAGARNANKVVEGLKGEIADLSSKIQNLQAGQQVVQNSTGSLKTVAAAVLGAVGATALGQKVEKGDSFTTAEAREAHDRVAGAHSNVWGAIHDEAGKLWDAMSDKVGKPLGDGYMVETYGFDLLNCKDTGATGGVSAAKRQQALDNMPQVAGSYITGTAQDLVPLKRCLSTMSAITTEAEIVQKGNNALTKSQEHAASYIQDVKNSTGAQNNLSARSSLLFEQKILTRMSNDMLQYIDNDEGANDPATLKGKLSEHAKYILDRMDKLEDDSEKGKALKQSVKQYAGAIQDLGETPDKEKAKELVDGFIQAQEGAIESETNTIKAEADAEEKKVRNMLRSYTKECNQDALNELQEYYSQDLSGDDFNTGHKARAKELVDSAIQALNAKSEESKKDSESVAFIYGAVSSTLSSTLEQFDKEFLSDDTYKEVMALEGELRNLAASYDYAGLEQFKAKLNASSLMKEKEAEGETIKAVREHFRTLVQDLKPDTTKKDAKSAIQGKIGEIGAVIPSQEERSTIEGIKGKLSGIAARKELNLTNPNEILPGDTIWSVTSEFDPMKEGGLGSVPPEIQSNLAALGLKMPMFIPAYENEGSKECGFNTDVATGITTYNYKGTTFYADKIAEMSMPIYKNGSQKENADFEFYISTRKTKGGKTTETHNAPLILVRHKKGKSFTGSIYSNGPDVEETEKFAILDKAVYEFTKARVCYPDGKIPENVLKVTDSKKFNSIGVPKGMILNDWQASMVAPLLRYKAPIEAAGGLSNTDTLSDMKLIQIVHNAEYKGPVTSGSNVKDASKKLASNVMNTLFGNDAHEIVSRADTGIKYNDLKNAFVLDAEKGPYAAFLQTGASLVDFEVPVSRNYGEELVSDINKSGALQNVFDTRKHYGSLQGITNGNDLSTISIESSAAANKALTGGVEFKTYNAETPLDEILQKRAQNKLAFMNEYLKPIMDDKKEFERLHPKLQGKIPEMAGVNANALPKQILNDDGTINEQAFLDTPIFSLSGRIVDQKGTEIAVGAFVNVLKTWDEKHPDKKKPILYISGADGEGGRIKNGKILPLIRELEKADNGDELTKHIIFAHGFAPSKAHFAATDFMLMTSKFEPCGLTQGESLAQGTPVIATKVGGLVDTIITEGEGKTGILTKTGFSPNGRTEQADIDEVNRITPEVTDCINQALDIYFNNHNEYEKMVHNAVKTDFSWIRADRKGAAYEYLKLLGGDTKLFPDKKELEAKKAA